MSRTRPATRRRRILSLIAAGSLAASLLSVAPAVPAAAQEPDPPASLPDSVTLVGSLQSELGCPGDWQPDCAATHLELDVATQTYSGTFAVPAGSHEFKVAINDSWDESYGQDGANIPLTLAGLASVEFGYDPVSHRVSLAPVDLPETSPEQNAALAGQSLRKDLTREQFYFVMADRFANGDPSNDAGKLTGDRLTTGLDPTAKGFYHGGDLKGITDKLDYLKGLGVTSIWMTPSFKNKPVQGTGDNVSAGYHGYWITDFTQIDPHLGTNEELKTLIDEAHGKGLKVFFDIITNHTADVISTKSNYITKKDRPYTDAAGNAFDDIPFATGDTFPTLDPQTSFPYVPVLAPGDEDVKEPGWLNNPTYYHNRGNANFDGTEGDVYGDFVGLDDLFTEQPKVRDGLIDIYKSWAEFGIDGFRIDTVKHVNIGFWQKFSPEVLKAAKEAGKDKFFMFGEVYDANPKNTSRFTTEGKLQATLDFGFQAQATAFGQGKPTVGLRDLFANDDYYTDADSNVYSAPTFLGNHDMGRIGNFLTSASSGPAELQQRDELAHSLMYVTRGQPVVYYGDEQGFVGDLDSPGDQNARQDMFPSRVATYNDDPLIGTDKTTADDNFDTSHPLYQYISPAVRAAEEQPRARRWRPDSPVRLRQGGRLRLQPDRRQGPDRVRRRGQQLDLRGHRDVRHLHREGPLPRCLAAGAASAAQRQGGPGHRHRAAAVGLGVEGGGAGQALEVRARRVLQDPGRRRGRRRARRGRGVRTGRRVQPGFPGLATRRDHRVDAARHRRQRAVPGVPRRQRAGEGHLGGVSRRAEGQRRSLVGRQHLRRRRGRGSTLAG